MTQLLQQAILEIEKLPADIQDGIASRLLAELADEQLWAKQFESTTDDQWAKLAKMAQAEIIAGDIIPFDDVFTSEE